MKKLKYSLLCLLPIVFNANAMDNSINFTGSVIQTTCNSTITGTISGSSHSIALGNVISGKKGLEKSFVFKLTDTAGTSACVVDGMTNAIIDFSGNFGAQGLNTNGGTGAVVLFNRISGSPLKVGSTSVTDTLTKFATGVEMVAALDAKNATKPGAANATVTYTIKYS